MKKLFIIALLSLCVFNIQNIFAEANDKSVEELLKASKAKDEFQATMNLMMDEQKKAFGGQGKASNEIAEVLSNFNKKYMTWELLKDDIKKAYQETFTEDEVQAMIKFYSTPEGQSIVTKQPQLTRKIMTITTENMQKHMPELQKNLMEVIKKKYPSAAKAQ